MPDAFFVFLAPPSWDEMVRRLVGRGTESPEERARRLDTARDELAAEAEFDVTIVNDDVHAGRRRARIMDGCVAARPWRPVELARSDQLRLLSTGGHRVSGTAAVPEGITNPPIDDLLQAADSKYALVIYAAKRARQINAYYSQLGEGLLEYVGPLVETHVQEKPLSVALREINEGLLVSEPPSSRRPEPRPAA